MIGQVTRQEIGQRPSSDVQKVALIILGLSFHLAFLSSKSPAFAGDSMDLQATLRTEERTPGRKTRVIDFSGRVEDFPQGATVSIDFILSGNTQFISRYTSIVDKDSSIKGQTGTMTKDFLPGVYEFRFWLHVGAQNKEIKQWFNLNRGWTSTHSELLKIVEINVGDADGHLSAKQDSMTRMKGFFESGKKVFGLLDKRIASGKVADAEWLEGEKLSILNDLREGYDGFDTWQTNYVALPFEGIRYKIQQVFLDTSSLLTDYSNGADLEILGQRIRFISSAIRFLTDTFSADKPVEVPLPKD